MRLDWKGIENIEYECVKCGATFKGKEMLFIDELKCPQCGSHMLKKTRPPIVRRVKAL
jgi:DNA-directed RNA polymerase subunit RPC12/RpoP